MPSSIFQLIAAIAELKMVNGQWSMVNGEFKYFKVYFFKHDFL
jgi:hypothetical protein